MKLQEIIKQCGFELKTQNENLNRDVTGGYSSDLLSDVMANAKDGNIWTTLQTHSNIVAVAVLKNLAGIILVNNRVPEEGTLAKANEENIPIMTTKLSTFEIVGKLYELGIKGN
ncbi:MAG: serine kinase [Spirochaetes bacterium RBG_16_49_21]|nr:MAG: serine kinase [Spirochaetes bacterium RBG_16_49_21]